VILDDIVPLGRAVYLRTGKIRQSKNTKWANVVVIRRGKHMLVIPTDVVVPLRNALTDIVAKPPAPRKKKIFFRASTTRRGTIYNASGPNWATYLA
jgi:hypothetical protein